MDRADGILAHQLGSLLSLARNPLKGTTLGLGLKRLFVSDQSPSSRYFAATDLAACTPNLLSISLSCTVLINGLFASQAPLSDQWTHLEHLEILQSVRCPEIHDDRSFFGRDDNGDDPNQYISTSLNIVCKYLPALWRVDWHVLTKEDVLYCEEASHVRIDLREHARLLNEKGRQPPISEKEAGLYMVKKQPNNWQGAPGWDPQGPRYASSVLA
ncbi:MAG: hypothetical protein Q9227_001181 [Pyrenula ochraceoflavens]